MYPLSTNPMTKKAKSKKQTFQAEVQQLLDIVIHSLYTDKEIFVRELVSNAADSLEKMHHMQLKENDILENDSELEIQITLDEEAGTFTISDSGIGMSRDELTENLGTIAHSGSKKFLQSLSETGQKEANLIGQFGVGFYSTFMVADKVQVYTRSWNKEGESLVWESNGKADYTIEDADDEKRGCRIVIHLRDEHKDFSKKDIVQKVLKTYSNFVPFPILLNDERVNKVEALWRKNKTDISDEDYTEFYRFTANAFDEPRYRMHFSADAPIEINALLFVPSENQELWGMGQMEAGVSLYCKNILIDDKPEGLLPEWLRFLKGVIDSSDLPLSLSRESMQDSAMIQKLNRVITRRFLKFLTKEAKSDPEKYIEFYKKFNRFLKEGVASDPDNQEDLAQLLRFQSSFTDAGDLTSLEEYLDRAKEDQKQIYYLIADDRKAIEAGPYLEAFKSRGLEVIYFLEPIDDYVVSRLGKYKDKELVSADRADIDLDDSVEEASGESLDDDSLEALCTFIKDELGEQVEKVETGKRLIDSPAATFDPGDQMTIQMRRMMQALNPDEEAPPIKVNLQINPRHALIHKLSEARSSNPDLAKLVAAQLLDTSLLASGLLDDRTSLINRGFDLMASALDEKK